MRTGENNINLTELEKKEGQKAARALTRGLRNVLARLTVRKTGQLLKLSKANAKMKFDALDNITITSPHYAFKQHHGFEGIKSNGVKMRLKPLSTFNLLLDNNQAIERLADAIGNLRAEEVTSKISW